MKLVTLATLLSLPIAVLVAWNLGGALGTGVLFGYTLGALVSVAGVMWQEHLLVVRPRIALHAFALTFLVKLGLVIVGGFLLRFCAPAAAWADWRGFLVAFPIAVLFVTAVTSWRHFGLLAPRRVAARAAAAERSAP